MRSNDLASKFQPLSLELERHTQAYPVLSLPNEIVSEIFLNFLPTYPNCAPLLGLHSPLALCRICRQFRAVAFSTPKLWRAIKIDMGATKYELELFQTWLARSGDCPLSLSLDFELLEGDSFPKHYLQAAVLHCKRWEHVKICMPFEYLDVIQGEMPLLRNLTFGPAAGAPASPSETFPMLELFDHAPQLENVILTRYFFKSLFRLPWLQLTHIDGPCLYARECAEILRDATNLAHATFGVCYTSNTIPIPVVPVHHHLRYLILSLSDGSDYVHLRELLDNLTLPALCALQVYEPGITLDILKEFISRSRCNLENLRVEDSEEEEMTYRAALPFIRDITLNPW
ncbi:F-box domain-containing protein [Mycena venus]|uniref:F-box domain-containing protein n=1 Tax=Mycena venus TaxID=2733690 RepID=A0A8H7CY05_9AGAR|nr:F-box domain-containing protein [Mycena venus]